MTSDSNFVELFRGAAPYIYAHNDKTFVLQIGGDVVASEKFSHLIHDLALLNALGIKLVVVFGVRPQIDELLQERNISPKYSESLRITDEASLSSVKQAVGDVKIQIEALLSMGLPNSSVPKADIKVTSGNYVTGKPYGVIEGVDFKLTGRVRSIETETIQKRLESGEIVLVTPLGYSSTGEIFNLSSIEVATEVAINLKADKLIMLSLTKELNDVNGKIIRQLTCEQAKDKLGTVYSNIDESPATALALGVKACESGVKRVHYIDKDIDGGILYELFTLDGVGTLLSNTPFDKVRPATVNDVGGIYELIIPLVKQGVLVERSIEKIEAEINDFKVLVRDENVIACAALHNYQNGEIMEIACMVVHPDYQNKSMGDLLYKSLESLAIENGAKTIIVLTTQTAHWFIERGFKETDIKSLPVEKKDIYDYQRNSKTLIKDLNKN